MEPNNRWYNLETMVKFSCPKTFYLVDEYGKKKDPFVWLKCTLNGWNNGWNHPWPKCRGLFGPYNNFMLKSKNSQLHCVIKESIRHFRREVRPEKAVMLVKVSFCRFRIFPCSSSSTLFTCFLNIRVQNLPMKDLLPSWV